jgi:hypothetical protein
MGGPSERECLEKMNNIKEKIGKKGKGHKRFRGEVVFTNILFLQTKMLKNIILQT